MKHLKLSLLFLLCVLMAVPVSAKRKTKVIAHRGYWKTEGSAQNSIRSLERANEIKVYGSEFDVHLTADNVPVVYHDRKIEGKDIQTASYAELKDLKLSNGETLPTLEQYLDRAKKLKKTKLIFELKSHATPLRDREAAKIVVDMVNGYDIDGIHFDYIRYPEQAKSFPDKNLYNKYGKKRPLAEWRRENINKMVYRIYDWVKSVKPWIQVSSSPLGKYNRIERVPNAGWTAYESVFQDPKMWMQNGKQDMIVPMMYYLHDNFFPFVDNWVDNRNGRLVVPGLGAYRMLKEEADWTVNDITDQIDYSRYYGGAGCTFFRCANILDNTKGIYDELKDKYYKYPAQLPPLSWLDDTVPAAPEEIRVEKEEDELKLSWQKPDSVKDVLTYTVYYSLTDSINPTSARNILMTGIRDTSIYLPVDTTSERGYIFSVSSSTRYHIESVLSKETYYYLSKYPK